MGLFSFLKDAGEKLFGSSAPAQGSSSSPNKKAEVEISIFNYISQNHLPSKNLSISFDEATSTVTVRGTAPDQVTHEKILLCCGNVQGVQSVDDQMDVEQHQQQEEPSQMYTVVKGDTLSKIAKDFYGDANKYHQVFEANQPMLSSPDRIYPGQVLRMPAL